MADLVIYPEVEKFLDDLEDEARAKVSVALDLLERFGNELREPHTKKLTKNIFELRTHGRQEMRLLFGFGGGKIYILTGFMKKTQKTPRTKIERAEREFKALDI